MNHMTDYAEGDVIVTREDAVLEVIDRDVNGYALSHLMYAPAMRGEKDIVIAKEGPLAGLSLVAWGHLYLPYRSHYVPGSFLIPSEAVKYHHYPETKAREAFFGNGDEELKRVVVAISAGSAVAPFSVGIGGSALLGIPSNFVKIVVYGIKHGIEVISFMKETGLSTQDAKKKVIRKRKWMSDEVYSRLIERKQDVGEIEGKLVRISVVLPRQVSLGRSGRIVHSQDGVEGEAKVSDDELGPAFPSRYFVKGDVQEIIVYDEDFVGLATVNETVKYRGRLETVEGDEGKIRRIIVGGRNDYVFPKA